MKVKYIGTTDLQVTYFGNDDPRDLLCINNVYTLKYKKVHDWHTDYILEEFPNKKFNSVSFLEMED